jgi:Bacterial SH3 domain
MRTLSVVCLMILLGTVVPSWAQQSRPPLVVFIEESAELNMSSVTDTGPDGLTRLAEFFRRQGARTTWVRLRDDIPSDASVIVLVRPRRPLSVQDLARIWLRVSVGASLLVALEPQGYLATSTENENSGLNKLITEDQGVSLLNGILVEPWFTIDSFKNLYSTFSLGFVDSVPNLVSDPLRRYDLPIALWGARPLRVEPLGVDSLAWALVDTIPEYAETATDFYPSRTKPGGTFGLDIGKDYQGQLNVAAIGENTRVGSRIAVFGDGEAMQNGYGLSLAAGGATPTFPGNYILVQRLVAWLLHAPEDQYPPLPTGLTWIAIDGQIDDWPKNALVTPDAETDSSILSLNIRQVRAARNDSYLYMAIETAAQPSPDSQIDMEIASTVRGQANTIISMQPGHVFAQSGTQDAVIVSDAAMAVGDVIEVRLPLRLTGQTPRFVGLCLSSTRALAFPQPPDCMDTPPQIGRISQIDPAPLRYTTSPLVALQGDLRNRINVRATPATNGRVLATLPYGTVFAAVGRNNRGNWIQVQNAALVGWVGADTLFTPGDLAQLPVTG